MTVPIFSVVLVEATVLSPGAGSPGVVLMGDADGTKRGSYADRCQRLHQ